MKQPLFFLLFLFIGCTLSAQNYVDEVLRWRSQQEQLLQGGSPDQLSASLLERYLIAVRSEAECRYMLDDYSGLEECAVRYWNTLDSPQMYKLDKETIRDLFSYGYKMLGSWYYGHVTDEETYDEALRYYTLALQYADPYQYNHLAVLYSELAQLHYKYGLYANNPDPFLKARQSLVSALGYQKDNETETRKIQAQEALCLARAAALMPSSDSSLRLYTQSLGLIDQVLGSVSANSDDYYEMLRQKAKILMLGIEYDRGAPKNARTQAVQYYRSYFQHYKKQILSTLQSLGKIADGTVQLQSMREHHWLTMRQLLTDCCRLEDADPAFLYDVALFSKALLQSGSQNAPTWQQVQRKLKADDCAVEFLAYEKKGSRHLAALVLHATGKPRFVYMYPVSWLEDGDIRGGWSLAEALLADEHTLKDSLYTDSLLARDLWSPDLLGAIDTLKTRRLFFSPDGLFHRLAIEYLWPCSGSLDASHIYRLSSTRQLLVDTPKSNGARTKGNGKANSRGGSSAVLLFGDIDYSHDVTPHPLYLSQPNDSLAQLYFQSLGVKLKELDGTRAEVDSIYRILSESALDQSATPVIDYLYDTAASEYSFRQLAPRYSVIHLATHGICGAPMISSTDLRPHLLDLSMSTSGIALAGINVNHVDSCAYDGFLSATELSQLDLHGVDLVVLSACQSGLGFLTEDGLFGLQRGLKNAGVKGLIVSLWSVDDDATAFLMKSLYKNMQDHDIHTAFFMAREELKEYEETKILFNPILLRPTPVTTSFNKPRYYDAFIMIDLR